MWPASGCNDELAKMSMQCKLPRLMRHKKGLVWCNSKEVDMALPTRG